jgi:hypothetical protein
MKEKRAGILLHIDELWNVFGNEAVKYLKSSDGRLNKLFYEDAFDKRLKRDLDNSKDDEFRDRYLNGYTNIDVPRFRMDTAAWKDFVKSFAGQLHLESMKGRSESLVFHRISKALQTTGNDAEFDSPPDILKFIRDNWNNPIQDDDGGQLKFGEYIDLYPKDL